MSNKSLVIVESPTKAKTITKFLGKDFIVRASNGHIRDLPNSAAEVPEKLKKEAWAKVGVNVDKNFEPLYIIPASKKDHVKKLKEDLKNASILYLATDEDREGESISWHLLEVLKPTIPVKRLVFHEITKEAIQDSLDNARDIDQDLVKAQETRRVVDRLYGYEVSPLLWKKMVRGLSAGRVQSVAVRLLVERERERISFTKASYWTLKGTFLTQDQQNATIEAELSHVGNKRIAAGKDFDPVTGKLIAKDNVAALNQADAETLLKAVQGAVAQVSKIEEKPFTSKPAPPFTTSTLQQEGNRKLRLSAKRTMGIAQQLYENGYITYMRTDSTTLSSQAINAARTFIEQDYGKEFLPAQPRVYETKVKNAQEAHEAIRPAGERFTPIEEVKEKLGLEAFRLYELIWKRTVASQMADAKGKHTSIQIIAGDATFRTSGKTIDFPGFLRAYVEGSDDPEADLADQEVILPKVNEQQKLATKNVEKMERTTQAAPRYTEGSLIKELERRGIGRPSTWASVVDTVLNRGYAFKKANALVPSFTGMAVVNLLEKHFEQLVDYEFTANLEDDLDAISRGEAENVAYLSAFYFGKNAQKGLKELTLLGGEQIDPREVCGVSIGRDENDTLIEVRIGKYGPFISDGENRASVPDGVAPDELTMERAAEILKIAKQGPEPIGIHPETKEAIYLKIGPYGPYVQLGEKSDENPKPKMASLLPDVAPNEVTLEYAVKLFTLPRTLGKHAESGEEIIATNGKFGPYVKCGAETRSINLDELSPLDITLEQALELLSQPKRRGKTSTPKKLREIGKHPVSEKEITLRSGRYGPYVTDGEINASVPKGMDAETMSLDDAVNLLEERARKLADGTAGGKRKKKKAEPKKKAAPKEKKTATKKAPAKKNAATKTKSKTTKAKKE